jgi:two-component system cell cycle sensor histidine kinase/response regulator CckA
MRHRPGDQSFADIMQIRQNANRAANLVRQLLAFSRQQTLQPRVLNVTDALAELSNLLRRLIGASIELKMVHGRDLGLVRVDQGQLEQVIINLAVNARDAMVGGGTLSIHTFNVPAGDAKLEGLDALTDTDYVAIEMVDTGSGIAKEHLDKIFEPFFTTKEVGMGTGLGLSTVYGIIKQTGGLISVASEVGKGATFTIFLPRHEGEVAEALPAPPRESARRRDLTGAGVVLLVEDEDAVRKFGARALRNKGYTVIEASNGEGALEVLEKGEAIDILITDIVMPGVDGPSLIRQVRDKRPELKVICISGYTEDSFRKRLDLSDNIHFLSKPFSLQQLAGKVKEVIHAP